MPLLSAVLPALAITALAEFLLVRVALRLGPAFPAGRVIDAGFDAAYWLGIWALNVAGILAITVLSVLAVSKLRRGDARFPPGIAAACAAALVLLVGWILSMVGLTSTVVLIVQVASIAAAIGVMALTAGWRGWRRWWLLGVMAAYLAATVHFFARLTGSSTTMSGGLVIAEAVALVAATVAPAVWRVGWRPRMAALAFAVAMLWGGFAASQPHIARFFVIWDLGLSSPLPWWTFAIALAGLVYGVGAARRHQSALGFAIVALAGLRLDYTYFALLALVGFAVIVTAPDPGRVFTIPSRPGEQDSRASHAGKGNWRQPNESAPAIGT